MEPVLTPAQMRSADEATIASGVHAYALMDHAAYACAVVALRMLGGAYGRRVLVVAGRGNNGGDGIACAGHLARSGALVDVLLVGEPAGDPARHLRAVREQAPAGSTRFDAWSSGRFEQRAPGADLVVDAVFGTGFTGAARGTAAEAIAALASCSRPVLSIDIPSGVSGADGSIDGVAVQADVTVAIQALKVGHVAGPGSFHSRRVEIADIGIALDEVDTWLPGTEDVRALLPIAPADTHKYAMGVLAVLAGSAGMTGAAVLCASAAMRTGAGMVFLGMPASCVAAVEQRVVEAVKVALPERDGCLYEHSVDVFTDSLRRAGALAIGPGVGRGPHVSGLLRTALRVPVPLVIDADGLTALAEILHDDPRILHTRPAATVLTPHGGEYARLAGREASPAAEERIERARSSAQRWGAVVHLKGRRAVTAAPDGTVWVNPTGNPGMATGGTGDVLTGVIATLLAQGLPAPEATWAGAFVHGLAGDVAEERTGRRSMTASDVIESLPRAFERIRWRDHTGRAALRSVLESV